MVRKWVNHLLNARRNSGADLLAKALKQYPPLELPFSGPPNSFSDVQAISNLEYILGEIPQRLAALRTLLKQTGQPINWPENFANVDVNAFVIGLHLWAGEHWASQSHSLPKDARGRWLNGEKSGEDIIFSLVTDVTLTLGELICTHRPTLDWGIDQDPLNRSDNMETVNRVMLLGHWRNDPSKQIEIDIEATVVNRLLNPNHSCERFENTWLKLVRSAIEGGYEGVHVVDDYPY
jgi:hypothetical protein